ncbi:translation initiation factor IF-2 [Candidatus Epulonipiscioides gigas]|nr:translation initiation factor IF-2 [Epulopiscium sp. SCG-C07WGA-EpuloA2]
MSKFKANKLTKNIGMKSKEITNTKTDKEKSGNTISEKPKFTPSENKTQQTNISNTNKQNHPPKQHKVEAQKTQITKKPQSNDLKKEVTPSLNNLTKKVKKPKKNKRQEKVITMEENTINSVADEIKVIEVGATTTIKQIADKIGVSATEIIKEMMKKGKLMNMNQEIDFDTAIVIGEIFNVLVEKEDERDLLEEIFGAEDDDESKLVERPPVVVVMGHVDHGKTSLLDAIRSTNVTTGEAGGITQHIGASAVTLNGKKITFLDTPGHEAFTAMRMRGAQVTDIAILVVAADDGVMPQTIEAINHAKAANVQIIVAVNKIDKPGANPDRVKQELAEHGLLVEEWGGQTICVHVSALKKEGIDNLLEMILLVAEMSDLKANPNGKARGTVIEAELDKGRGPVATVLVQNGTLKIGDPIVVGETYGRIRAMNNYKGKPVKKATPSTAVEILGLSEVPIGGDMFYIANNDKQARQVAEKVKAQGREKMVINTPQKVSLDDLYSQIQEGQVKELNLIVKADVQGSVEAVKSSLEKLSTEAVRVRTIHGGVGAITESDVTLASASGAIIIGFNVRPDQTSISVAQKEKVDIRLYRIIYKAIEDIESAMKGMLDPEYQEVVIGHVEIRQTFKVSGIGTIGGAYVKDGKITRGAGVRVVRDGIVVYEGALDSLKRFKDDAKEVATGYECGITIEKYNDIKEGDIVEAFVMEEIKR